MKKVFFLIVYLLFFFLTAFVASAAFLGVRSNANLGSIAILFALATAFLLLTITFYKLYKKQKGGNK